MNLDSLLPGLITGLITGVIALSGVIYTQRQAAQREDHRWNREAGRQQEERQWQRELWARDHRRRAHLTFLAEQRRLDHWMMMVTRVGLEGVEAPEEDWLEPLGRRLLDVQVFGSQEAAVAAGRLYRATEALESGAVGHMALADEAIETYRRLVQRDLGLRETSLAAWGAEDDPDGADVGGGDPRRAGDINARAGEAEHRSGEPSSDPGRDWAGVVRRELPGDRGAVAGVHAAAFGDGQAGQVAEARLVDELRADGDAVPALSLVALLDDVVVGHVLCSRGQVGGRPLLGLGPLGVLPAVQRRGVGQALMHAVLAAADALDEPAVVLLGDPAYYRRFGFVPAAPVGLQPPDARWGEHFQVRLLTAWDGSLQGTYRYAPAFERL